MATRKKSRDRSRSEYWQGRAGFRAEMDFMMARWRSGLLTHQLAEVLGVDEDIFRKGDVGTLPREKVIEMTAKLNELVAARGDATV